MPAELYQEAIAPYRSSYFGALSSPRLSPETRLSLAREFTGRLDAIDERRSQKRMLALNEQLGRVKLESAQQALFNAREESKWRRQLEADTLLETPELDAIAKSGDREAARQWGIRNAGLLARSPVAAQKFRLALDVPERETVKPSFTATQIAGFVAKGVPPEVAATGDPFAIGQYARKAAEEKAAAKKEADAFGDRLLGGFAPLAGAAATGEPAPEVSPEQWANWSGIANRFGTAKELAEYNKLADTDPRKAGMKAGQIRDRVLRERQAGMEPDPLDAIFGEFGK